jgi:hypothetical protein
VRQIPADPVDERSSGTEILESMAVEIHHDQGTICVYRHDRTPLIKITGLPTPLPELSKAQFTIDIAEQGAKFHYAETPSTCIAETRIPSPAQS